MKINGCMTMDVKVANPEQSIRDAAKMMDELDAGIIPVGENDRLVGMITDRDIAIRGVALGKGPDTSVREVMSGTSSETWATFRCGGSQFSIETKGLWASSPSATLRETARRWKRGKH